MLSGLNSILEGPVYLRAIIPNIKAPKTNPSFSTFREVEADRISTHLYREFLCLPGLGKEHFLGRTTVVANTYNSMVILLVCAMRSYARQSGQAQLLRRANRKSCRLHSIMWNLASACDHLPRMSWSCG